MSTRFTGKTKCMHGQVYFKGTCTELVEKQSKYRGENSRMFIFL